MSREVLECANREIAECTREALLGRMAGCKAGHVDYGCKVVAICCTSGTMCCLCFVGEFAVVTKWCIMQQMGYELQVKTLQVGSSAQCCLSNSFVLQVLAPCLSVPVHDLASSMQNGSQMYHT